MVFVERSIDIATTVSEVWLWIVEPEKYLVWNTDFQEYRISKETDGRLRDHVSHARGRSQLPGLFL